MSLDKLKTTLYTQLSKGQEMRIKMRVNKVLALTAACALVFGACSSGEEATPVTETPVTEAPVPEVALASEECAIPVPKKR